MSFFSLDKKSRILIAKAFQEFQNKTCIRFVPKSNEKDYIFIENGKGWVKFNICCLLTDNVFAIFSLNVRQNKHWLSLMYITQQMAL